VSQPSVVPRSSMRVLGGVHVAQRQPDLGHPWQRVTGGQRVGFQAEQLRVDEQFFCARRRCAVVIPCLLERCLRERDQDAGVEGAVAPRGEAADDHPGTVAAFFRLHGGTDADRG